MVFQCLQLTCTAIHKLIDNQRSVIITDDDGYNASAVVASLVQICADRFYRTIAGLSSLIEKEWIALGHPFGSNMFGCSLSSRIPICADRFCRTIAGLSSLIEKEWIALGHPFGSNMFGCSLSSRIPNSRSQSCTATFLLFLDCIAQLIRLHPLAFEYSQHFLIALWDLSITGLAS
ncbi:unnamed protein product [Gongylonema pulchrum]|uniref:Myotubularin phosphatase domain-containing protein n=1 Tax=Gongylonema pulchrum TaxID=637853 RepID=A0A3P7NZV8_9BILA|nr:unnamed protein product [Gongylonema pulchrum]